MENKELRKLLGLTGIEFKRYTKRTIKSGYVVTITEVNWPALCIIALRAAGIKAFRKPGSTNVTFKVRYEELTTGKV